MNTTSNKKLSIVLAVASRGGHSKQMDLIVPAFNEPCFKVVRVTTWIKHRPTNPGFGIPSIPDATRWSVTKNISCLFSLVKIIHAIRPALIISTGAAPGVLAITVGRLYGIPSIWVDSLANTEHLSLSGKIACKLSNVTLTQWKHLGCTKNDLESHKL